MLPLLGAYAQGSVRAQFFKWRKQAKLLNDGSVSALAICTNLLAWEGMHLWALDTLSAAADSVHCAPSSLRCST